MSEENNNLTNETDQGLQVPTQQVDDETMKAVAGNEPIPGTESMWNEETKSYNVESLAKSYAELRKAYTKSTQGEEPETPKYLGDKTEEKTEADKPKDESQENAAENIVNAAGVDVEQLQKEWAESGKIGDENREKIEKVLQEQFGLGGDAIDAYLAGVKAEQEKNTNAILSEVGGVEQYNKMISWAEQNYSAEEIASYANALQSPDVNVAKMAVQALNAKYTAAEGSAPSRSLSGTGTPGESVKPYASIQEASAATQNPRYNTDPAFRKEHAERLAATMKRG